MMKSASQDTSLFDMLTSFILVENINSFQKLNFLLWLYEHHFPAESLQELADQLYFGDIVLLKQIIAELKAVGLLTCKQELYELSDDPYLQRYLQYLAIAFADPLVRQQIVERVKDQSPRSLLARSILNRYHH